MPGYVQVFIPFFSTNLSEIITLQVGQCGNQVGLQYWNQLAGEHGIDAEGFRSPAPAQELDLQTNSPSQQPDRPDVFFSLSDSNKYTPRSILIDLEPSVVSRCVAERPQFNPRNVHVSDSGSGAGNNWQNGYEYGQQHADQLMAMVDREMDRGDNVLGLQLFHSVAGGTGAGVGSFLLELLADRYGSKKMVTTFSVFPLSEKASDVVVQPYNTMLTLKRLIEFSDAAFVFENDALTAMESLVYSKSSSVFESSNKLISYVCAQVLNPLRFPSYMYSSHESILLTLVPTPDLKFLLTAVAPLAVGPTTSNVRLNEYDIILELANDRYKMNRVTTPAHYISVLNFLVGSNLNQNEIRKGAAKVSSRIEFVPWTSASVHQVNGRKSPFEQKPLSGVQVSNNTSMATSLLKIVRQYDLLAKRQAYMNNYTHSNDAEERARVIDMFGECRDAVMGVVNEYKACSSMSFLEDDE